MGNEYEHNLTVIGLKETPNQFANALEKAVYGDNSASIKVAAPVEVEGLVRRLRPQVEVEFPNFHFETATGPDLEAMAKLSEKTKGVWFLLKYSSWESGCRGQAVIRDGKVIEQIHRVGYHGPGYLFADVTHPLVDLSAAYAEPTLALKARRRLLDAVQIVRELKDILEDPRFANSQFRTLGDDSRVKQTHAGLTAMLTAMMGHAREISFEGVLVEEPTENLGARTDGRGATPKSRKPRKKRPSHRRKTVMGTVPPHN